MRINIPKFSHRIYQIKHNKWYPAPIEVFVNSLEEAHNYSKEHGFYYYKVDELSNEYAKEYLNLVFGKDFDGYENIKVEHEPEAW